MKRDCAKPYFPNVLKYNIAMARRSLAPGVVSQAESPDIDTFFKGGKARMDARYAKVSHVNNRIEVVGNPGQIFIINTSPKHLEARDLLMKTYASSKLPTSVVSALKDFDSTVEKDMTLMIESLNDSLALDRRNILDNDIPSAVNFGSASGLYWSRFAHLKNRAEAINTAIRGYLNLK
jgi:hypothetical protein